ncbi:tripartite tricarboxylate transporter permease [Micromonospora sp. NBRC 101691]|uniref:tripartite tricarboxylate transporter permease n=1 Tax=Micromonospora sp. NBRC 101691 TaxID=3032198 RepID=UPI0024A593C8|nr:tripartite tricarboxylate transporter permease [Micromonospora sp. NBRC 101691]GLY25879.1 C4-dicarboxylate ABC transporter permease [Micromonospora sp. NBRC 101691]
MNAVVEGFGALLTLEIAFCVLIGAAIGMLVGAFPGITATMAVALASAFTLTMDPVPGLAVLLTILIAAQFGDRVPAILINTPGTPASIATTFDGYALARQGKAGIALTASAYASAIGGFVGIAVLMFAAIPLSGLAVEFGSPEMFALVVFGLTMMIEVSGGRIVKGLIAGLFGLALGTIGRDPLDGSDRFTFGIPQLVEGIPFIAVIIGLFGIAEVFGQMLERAHAKGRAVETFGRWWPNRSELRGMVKPVAVGSTVGTVVGVLPAAGGDIGGIVAWNQAKKVSKQPEKFGKGSLEGLTAADSSSNAGVGGSVLTTLALGVPGDSVMAVMLGSMIIWGIQPGPTLFSQQPDLVYSIAGIMLFATVLTLGLSLLRMRGVAKLLELPNRFLWVVILTFCVVGTYAVNNSVFDVGLMILFGIVGLLFRRFGFPAGPVVLGLILGPLAERNFRRSMELGGLETIYTSPIAVLLIVAAVLAVAVPRIRARLKARRPEPQKADPADDDRTPTGVNG